MNMNRDSKVVNIEDRRPGRREDWPVEDLASMGLSFAETDEGGMVFTNVPWTKAAGLFGYLLREMNSAMITCQAVFPGDQAGTIDRVEIGGKALDIDSALLSMPFQMCHPSEVPATLAAYDWMVGKGREPGEVVISAHADAWMGLESEKYEHWSLPDEAFSASAPCLNN